LKNARGTSFNKSEVIFDIIQKKNGEKGPNRGERGRKRREEKYV
jgi:hypothetical protein